MNAKEELKMKVKKLAHKIEEHYSYHGVHIKLQLLSGVDSGERFVFRVRLKPGAKANLIFERASDVQMALHIQLFQPFRDGLDLYLAVSKNNAMQNSLMLMLKSRMFYQSRNWLPIAIGYNMRQEMVFDDLAKMPHVMYAGSTNSGKSMGLICLISSLIIKQPVRCVNLLIFDIGANSLKAFSDIPHLSYPIVKDYETGVYVIKKLVEEMEKRIKLRQDELCNLPAVVCVIDEYVSFINNISDKEQLKTITNDISNLIRRGRHAKIHMVISTQDPVLKDMKVDVGNITTRMAFRCAKCQNSIAILGESGAEKLPGNGALLLKSNDHLEPLYIQGAFISPNALTGLVDYVKAKEYDLGNKFLIPEPEKIEPVMQISGDLVEANKENEELANIIIWALGRDKISASQIMDRFSMGNRAYNIIEKLCEMGLVAEKFSNQQRKVLPKSVDDIPEELMDFLLGQGVSFEEIESAIDNAGQIYKDNIIT